MRSLRVGRNYTFTPVLADGNGLTGRLRSLHPLPLSGIYHFQSFYFQQGCSKLHARARLTNLSPLPHNILLLHTLIYVRSVFLDIFWYLQIRKTHPVYSIIPILQPTRGHSVCLLFEISKYFVHSRPKSVTSADIDTLLSFLSPDLSSSF